MKLIKPSKLNKNDLIGIISPASAPNDLSRIEKGTHYLESLGYRVKIGQNTSKYYGYLGGDDQQRVSDLHDMFADKEVKAIFCTRGGYGSGRLLDKIDYTLIKKNPKIFVGYSDITALQCAFYKKCGLVTFGGPMLAVDLYENPNPFTEEFFWNLLTTNKKLGRIKQPFEKIIKPYKQKNVEGILLGGNLSLIASLLGSSYLPSFANAVLLLEEVDEVPYSIDRMLYQLKYADIFKSIRGLLLGEFTDCEEKDETKKTLTLDEVLDDYLVDLDKPIIVNFAHGHVKETITVPFGIHVKINSIKGYIEYTENALV